MSRILAICLAFAVGGCWDQPLGDERARKVLSAAVANEWRRNPFPSDAIIRVRGVERHTRDWECWIRVDFAPEATEVIFKDIVECLQIDPSNTVVMRQSVGLASDSMRRNPPAFWQPDELGQAPTVFSVLRLLDASGGAVAGTTIILSREKPGIAYVHSWNS